MSASLRPLSLAASLLLLLLASSAVLGQSPPTLKSIRVGLPSGPDTGRSRNGAWTPIAVTLVASKEGHPQGAYRLRVETRDLEDTAYQYPVAVPAMASNQELTVQGYLVPGGDGVAFRAVLETTDDRQIAILDKQNRDSSRDELLGSDDVVFFTIGAQLSFMRRAAEKLDQPENKDAVTGIRARRQFTAAEELTLLPDRWFGYDGADVVLLTTGNREFTNSLVGDSNNAPARRSALLTWVRRGGTLVLSVGRNHQEAAALLKKLPLLSEKQFKLTGSVKLDKVTDLAAWATNEIREPLQPAVEVATAEIGSDVHVIVREANKHPLLVQASCGLGRVVVALLDLDAPPFTAWNGQQDFWTKLIQEISPNVNDPVANRPRGADMPPQPGNPRQPRGMPGFGDDAKYDYKTELKRGLEEFEETPTLSFGWVALFVLFYIILVGPLDYFVLKKVFKRLEWTWVTFPVTVIAVSVVAYLVAYALKGDEVRINKIDLVDLDLHEPRQVYGTSFFTLLSPRVQSYTLGLEPASGVWTGDVPEGAPGTTVTLLEVGEQARRTGSQTLFSRPYEYAENAVGVKRVPVPVWATRSFSASWQAPVSDKAPILTVNDGKTRLRKSDKDDNALVGKLTNRLPTDLQDVSLFYRGQLYHIKKLAPEESVQMEGLFLANAENKGEIGSWFDNQMLAPERPLAPSGRGIPSAFAQNRSAYMLIKAMMFFREAKRANADNGGLRMLDQSWRIAKQTGSQREAYRNEVILVARLPMLADHAEEVTKHGATPARLWLGDLPGPGKERPRTPGFITQETYLRVCIPVE